MTDVEPSRKCEHPTICEDEATTEGGNALSLPSWCDMHETAFVRAVDGFQQARARRMHPSAT